MSSAGTQITIRNQCNFAVTAFIQTGGRLFTQHPLINSTALANSTKSVDYSSSEMVFNANMSWFPGVIYGSKNEVPSGIPMTTRADRATLAVFSINPLNNQGQDSYYISAVVRALLAVPDVLLSCALPQVSLEY